MIVSKTVIRIMAMMAIGMACGFLALPQEKPVTVEHKTLGQYVGAYQWGANHFVYVRFWDELGKNQLVAFDESGEIRAFRVYPE